MGHAVASHVGRVSVTVAVWLTWPCVRARCARVVLQGQNVECFRLWEAAEYGSIPVIDTDEDVKDDGNTHDKRKRFPSCWDALTPFHQTDAPFLFVSGRENAWRAMSKLLRNPAALNARSLALRAWYDRIMRRFGTQLEDLLDAKMMVHAWARASPTLTASSSGRPLQLKALQQQVVQLSLPGSGEDKLHRFLGAVFKWAFKYLGSPIQTSCLGTMHHRGVNMTVCDFVAADQGRHLPLLFTLTKVGCAAINQLSGCTTSAAAAATAIGASPAAALAASLADGHSSDSTMHLNAAAASRRTMAEARSEPLIYPQLSHLKTLTSQEPHAKFVLLVRNADEWARTGGEGTGGVLSSRSQAKDETRKSLAAGPPTNVEGRAAWYNSANSQITAHFADQSSASKFIRHNLAEDDPVRLLRFLDLPDGFASTLKALAKENSKD